MVRIRRRWASARRALPPRRPERRRCKTLPVVLLLAIVLAVGSQATALSQSPSKFEEALREFQATDLDGEVWNLGALEGRVVLIDFWATWCAPCLAEIPILMKARDRFGPEGFEILSVSLDVTSRRSLISWLNRQRISWPQIHDGRGYSGDMALLFGIEQLPTSILVDRKGLVRGVDLRGVELVSAIESLVKEQDD